MTQLKWTSEPWKLTEYTNYSGYSVESVDRSFGCIAERWEYETKDPERLVKIKANGERIVSCVNFLAGIEDFKNKVVVSSEFVESANELFKSIKAMKETLSLGKPSDLEKEIIDSLSFFINRAEKAFGLNKEEVSNG